MGLGVIYVLYFVVSNLHMPVLTKILGYFKDASLIIIIVVFQTRDKALFTVGG
ncbi:hypothetical protein [Mucilaginibacter humi]|uniref:hypothetical protein n=1 Tax=Mucilaginibacter humi TaxID=2732510 RepID=UPI00293B94B0|nr:hypothetical protein [Mucilaginibacter humi]